MKNQKAVFSQNAAMKLTTPSRQFFKPALATTLAIGSWRLVLLLATAVSLIGYPKPATAATVNVWVGGSRPLIGPIDFAPSSVTIHPGDQVKWVWLTSGHSTTSGRPGMPNGIWDSGVRSQGATFTHTFNSVGTFPYYCTDDLQVGQVIVTPLPPPVTTDFNNDGKADFVLYNSSTHQTAIWYMNNNVHVATATDATPPGGWQVVGVADFNRDGHPDYLLFSSTSRATVIWYMDNNVHFSGNYGPAVPTGWTVVALADVNLDGSPDYLLFNANTGGTVVWYMRNNVHIGAAPGPAIPAGWTLAGVGDFNGDGHPDYLLFNANSGATVIWYMNNNVHVTGAYGPTLPAGWSVAGVADFNGDGHPDYLLFNEATRATVIWYMNNNIHVTGANGPTLPEGWSVVAP
jgi:plastocyanin/elongation factor P hydroxylase